MKITNSDTIKELQEAAGLQFGMDMSEKEIQKIVIPTIEINPKLLKYCNIVRTIDIDSDATSKIIFSTPSDRDFYLAFAQISYAKDNVGTATDCSIQCIPSEDNSARSILRMKMLALTTQTDLTSGSFSPSVKIKRGTDITLNINVSAAVTRVSGTITGFIDEHKI